MTRGFRFFDYFFFNDLDDCILNRLLHSATSEREQSYGDKREQGAKREAHKIP